MTRSVAIIGAGQIGHAAAQQFGAEGWQVRVLARSKPDWSIEKQVFERYIAGDDYPPEADVVVDTIAFDEDDAARYDPDRIGSLVVISSASVYCDEQGRTLDEGPQNGFPDFGGPITEEQSTVRPGPETYSTRKVRMENEALDQFDDRATVLRPCAIHGPHSRHPREWWFVKRLIDGRTQIPLSHRGKSRFQTTAAQSIGEMAMLAAERDVGGIFNIADDDAPSVSQVGEAIARPLVKTVQLVPLEEDTLDGIGRTPWSIPAEMIVSNEKAVRHGASRVSYRSAVEGAIDWLRDLNPTDWRAAFPQLAAYPWDLFDYEAEDRFLAAL